MRRYSEEVTSCIVGAISLVAAFIIYCWVRALSVSVGVDWLTVVRGTFAVVFMVGVPNVGVAFVLATGCRGLHLLITVLACLVGGLSAEARMLDEEVTFAKSVMRRGLGEAYAEPRGWPSHDSSLIFDPERGMYAND